MKLFEVTVWLDNVMLVHLHWCNDLFQPPQDDHAPGAPSYDGQILNPAQYQPQVQHMQPVPRHTDQVAAALHTCSLILCYIMWLRLYCCYVLCCSSHFICNFWFRSNLWNRVHYLISTQQAIAAMLQFTVNFELNITSYCLKVLCRQYNHWRMLTL